MYIAPATLFEGIVANTRSFFCRNSQVPGKKCQPKGPDALRHKTHPPFPEIFLRVILCPRTYGKLLDNNSDFHESSIF